MYKTPPQGLWAFIGHFVRPYKRASLIFILLAMAAGLWGPINSLLMKKMINVLAMAQPEDAMTVILCPAVLFVVNFEFHNLCWRVMGYINYKFQPVIKNQIITETFEYVHQHAYQFFQDNLAGRIANHIHILADNIERIVHDISRHILRLFVLLIMACTSMYYVHPKFFYILIVWVILFFAGSVRLSKRIVKLAESHAAAESLVAGQLVDSITNANNVRIFAMGLYELKYIQKALSITKQAAQTKEFFLIRLHLFQGWSLSAMLVFMLYSLIQLRIENLVSIGDYALVLGLSIEVGWMMWWTMEQVDELNKAIGKCNQSLKSIFVPLSITNRKHSHDVMIAKGEILFSQVKFNYKDAEPLFENKSVCLEAGKKVGLVGYSGGGKSTFVNLIMRLYEVTEGQILIDGQDIREVTQESLRCNIAMIPQDPSLFHRTLIENIRYGRITATDEEVYNAAKRAHAHEFIMALPQGYDSLVGERGVKLSGGQRQRIAIARAILKNAPILILDEATSQLDSVTEALIQESLWELMQGKTTLVIAHRLSTLLHMDRILVFEQGKIIEDGTHAELIVKDGAYKMLWDAQVGGFLPDQKAEGSEPYEA